MKLNDSNQRKIFASGAVRDITEGKGRCDLLPLGVIGAVTEDNFYSFIEAYIRTGETKYMVDALNLFIGQTFGTWETALLEVSKQFEDGARKYFDRNFEKGINLHCFVDSAIRHYLKFRRGDNDEPHERACLWNLLSLLWTHTNHPELNDLPFTANYGGAI